ncbi:hypothetical protein [Streptomyces sp. NPDC096132]|uniref:hypothetical protein n=1 Tax=Streptomyces sp. NPDC096132 TaxID=3366075 RepID=UPI0037FCD344
MGHKIGGSGVTWDRVNGTSLEVACDESGSDGENLTGGNTDVFAHASVRLPAEFAAAQLRDIRGRIRSPAEEYKATHLLREKHRAVLEWLLSESGPLYGHAHVHLVEKAFFVVDRTAGLLLDSAEAAGPLFREGRRTFTETEWRDFLAAANRLLRVRAGEGPEEPVGAFFRTVDTLRHRYSGTRAADILERCAAERSRAVAYRDGIGAAGPPLVPLLNPLLPAILRTAAHWSRGGRPVRLAHDRQNMLTPERIAWIEDAAGREGIGLAGLRLVVARDDARVQLADFLAGIARSIASDELNGRGDPPLSALLRPYTGGASVWGDEPSWARLNPAAAESGGPATDVNSLV